MESTTPQTMAVYVLPSWYNEAYYIFNYVICILQFFGFGINLIHFLILTRPQMRSNAVYRLMIGMCSCDLLTQINTFLIFSPFWIREIKKGEECYMTKTYFDAILILHGIIILDVTQRAASWMALCMALYRTLSVMFPLSSIIQNLTKPVFALWTILGALIFTSLTAWMVQANRFMKPYSWDYDCDENVVKLNKTRYAVIVPREYQSIQNKLVSAYGFIKALPSLIDPFLTVFLIIELRRASKRRKNVGKCEADKTENTTKLIIFVTCSFFFLEVPNGFSHIVNGFSNADALIKTISYMVSVFAEILPVINSSSHFFICLLMSALYRETAREIFGGCGGKRQKVIMVEECNSTKTR